MSIRAVLVLAALALSVDCGAVSTSRTRSPTPSVTPSVTRTLTPSITPTRTVTTTVTPTPSVTATPSLTRTRTPSVSATPSPSGASATASNTATASATNTAASGTNTASASGTNTASASSTNTASASRTNAASGSTIASTSHVPTPTSIASSSSAPTVSASPLSSPPPSGFTCPSALPGGAYVALSNNDTRLVRGAVREVVCSGEAWDPFRSTLWCTQLGWSAAPADNCLASLSCAGDGTLYRDDACQACPRGAFCPGGVRMWPLPGYWSHNETDVPLRCRNAMACPGAQGSGERSDGQGRETRVCAAAYAGDYCALCSSGHYRAYEVCLPCPSNARAGLAVPIICAIVLYGLMAAGVATLPVKPLGFLVTGLVAIQQLILVARMASTKVAGYAPWLATALNYLAVLSFDVEFATPECSVAHSISWMTFFWATLGVAAVVVAMFLAASALRAVTIVGRRQWCPKRCRKECAERLPDYDETQKGTLKSTADTLPSGIDWEAGRAWADEVRAGRAEQPADDKRSSMAAVPSEPKTFVSHFARRGVRSLLIAGTVLYFQICSRVFEGLSCTHGGSGQLRAQPSVVCFKGGHFSTFVMSVFLLAFYCVGFPGGIMFALWRLHQAGKLDDSDIKKRWGSLYEAVQRRYFWFKMSAFVTTFVITCVAATTDGTSPRLLASGIFFAVSLALLIALHPYERRLQNVWMGCLSFAKGLVPLVFLGVTDGSSVFFSVLAGTAAAVIVVAAVVALKRNPPSCCRKAGPRPPAMRSPAPFDSGTIVLPAADDLAAVGVDDEFGFVDLTLQSSASLVSVTRADDQWA